MPRWNRRERPDYHHLRGLADDAALVNAIRCPTYGTPADHSLLAGFHARLVAMWGEGDWIPLAELVAAHEQVRARDPGFFGHGRHWQGAFLHDVVGNLVGWGLRMEVLVEREALSARGFQLVRREPLFERMGNGRWRRIADAGTRGAGQREAYRIRHAAKIEPNARLFVGGLCDAGVAIPEAWFSRFPEQFARLKGLAERVADARTTFEEAHRGMHLADQKAWIDRLAKAVLRVPPPPELAPVPDEDAEALGCLA